MDDKTDEAMESVFAARKRDCDAACEGVEEYTITDKFDGQALRGICEIAHDQGWNRGMMYGFEFATYSAAKWLASMGQHGLAIDLLRQLNGGSQEPASA